MFNAVFFDMDGVTVDSEPQWHASERELMSEHGYTWLEEDQVACLGGPLSRVGEYMAVKASSDKPGSWFTEALILKQMEKMREGTLVLPGVLDLIHAFRKFSIPVALVSASPRRIMDAALAGISDTLFDFTISSDDVTMTKPDPQPYLMAAQRAGVDIKKSLVIEDSKTGIASATAAGAYVLAIPHFISVEPDARTKVVMTLQGLTPEAIFKLFN